MTVYAIYGTFRGPYNSKAERLIRLYMRREDAEAERAMQEWTNGQVGWAYRIEEIEVVEPRDNGQ